MDTLYYKRKHTWSNHSNEKEQTQSCLNNAANVSTSRECNNQYLIKCRTTWTNQAISCLGFLKLLDCCGYNVNHSKNFYKWKAPNIHFTRPLIAILTLLTIFTITIITTNAKCCFLSDMNKVQHLASSCRQRLANQPTMQSWKAKKTW